MIRTGRVSVCASDKPASGQSDLGACLHEPVNKSEGTWAPQIRPGAVLRVLGVRPRSLGSRGVLQPSPSPVKHETTVLPGFPHHPEGESGAFQVHPRRTSPFQALVAFKALLRLIYC